jgi:hypothetical protein
VQEVNLSKKGHTRCGHTRTTSLRSVQEDSDTLGNADQLPMPWETPHPEGEPSPPVISETLFTQTNILQESDDSGDSRTCTAASRNQIFTIADRTGIFEMEVIFCVCSDTENIDEQLLQSGMFPATFKQIESLFTFSVLEDFLADNLKCKTTAQQYYSKLQSMTSKMFPNSVPVCFSFMLSHRPNWWS